MIQDEDTDTTALRLKLEHRLGGQLQVFGIIIRNSVPLGASTVLIVKPSFSLVVMTQLSGTES